MARVRVHGFHPKEIKRALLQLQVSACSICEQEEKEGERGMDFTSWTSSACYCSCRWACEASPVGEERQVVVSRHWRLGVSIRVSHLSHYHVSHFPRSAGLFLVSFV